jgi:hypothetical protein
LIEIVIKVIGHKRTDMRVKRLFYNMDSVLARAEGIFLQPERRGLGQPEQSEAACRLSQPRAFCAANNTTLLAPAHCDISEPCSHRGPFMVEATTTKEPTVFRPENFPNVPLNPSQLLL